MPLVLHLGLGTETHQVTMMYNNHDLVRKGQLAVDSVHSRAGGINDAAYSINVSVTVRARVWRIRHPVRIE
jgi:hypothetical protein